MATAQPTDPSLRMPDAVQAAWQSVDSSQRFRYKMNRIWLGFLLGQLVIVWGYFGYTWASLTHWHSQLTWFVVIYGGASGWLLFKILRWRAFCVLSGVVVGTERLTWSTGLVVCSVPFDSLDVDRLGLSNVGVANDRLEVGLQIDLEDGSQAPLALVRPYAHMEGLEDFIEQILVRVAGDTGKRRGGANKKKQKKR